MVTVNSLETYSLLVITGANSLVTAVCILIQVGALTYYTSASFSHEMVPLVFPYLIMIVGTTIYGAAYLRTNSLELVR